MLAGPVSPECCEPVARWHAQVVQGLTLTLTASPSTLIRSLASLRCGLATRPVRRPAARSRASIMMAVLPLPLVPAI